MWSIEGLLKWLSGVREPVGYDWNARRITTLPKSMLHKSLEWKRSALLGEMDVNYTLELARSGWRPVRSIFGRPIERDGLRLMWREAIVSDCARTKDATMLNRQLASAQQGATLSPALSGQALALDFSDEAKIGVLATRGRLINWGFDPYEGIEDGLDAVEKLLREDRAKKRVVAFPSAETETQAKAH